MKRTVHTYKYDLIAGDRGRPQGWIGTYATKAEALAHHPLRYSAYVKRVRVPK